MPTLTEEGKITGSVPPPTWPQGHGDNGDSEESGPGFPISAAQLGVYILLTGIVMLFAGLTSAYVVLRGAPSWQNVEMPQLLWLNTAVLVASSVTIDQARRSVQRNQSSAMRKWLVVSGVLGSAFLAGQLFAWQQLVAAGVYLPSALHGSFFYLLTGIHGIHLLGGIIALAYVSTKALKNRLTASSHEPLTLCATYWHFMDGLWVYLLLLLLLA